MFLKIPHSTARDKPEISLYHPPFGGTNNACSSSPTMYEQFTGVHLQKFKKIHSTITTDNRMHVGRNSSDHIDLRNYLPQLRP